MRMLEFDTHSGARPAGAERGDLVQLADGLTLQGVRMHYDRNAEIFGAEEPADFVYLVRSGAVRTIAITSDGRRQIMGFHLPGDLFGFEMGAEHAFSAEAVSACDVILIRRSVLERAAASEPQAARALLGLMAAQLESARAAALLLGKKGAEERVAGFLLSLAERQTAQQMIDLPMSRADIADYLGLTIETISRTLTLMERRGDIALPSARKVVLKHRHALEMLEAA